VNLWDRNALTRLAEVDPNFKGVWVGALKGLQRDCRGPWTPPFRDGWLGMWCRYNGSINKGNNGEVVRK